MIKYSDMQVLARTLNYTWSHVGFNFHPPTRVQKEEESMHSVNHVQEALISPNAQ